MRVLTNEVDQNCAISDLKGNFIFSARHVMVGLLNRRSKSNQHKMPQHNKSLTYHNITPNQSRVPRDKKIEIPCSIDIHKSDWHNGLDIIQ